MTVITKGRIVTPHGVLEDMDLVLEEDKIKAILPVGITPLEDVSQVIDAQGGFITPGFIDIHSDYIEHMAAPRPTSLMDFSISLRETEKELITHGITTMFHSLSLFKTTGFPDKPIRNPENIRKFVDIIEETHHRKHLIRHRFHARFEIDNLERVEELASYIKARKVHLLSFMDHTPGQGQYRDLEMYKKTLQGYRRISEQEVGVLIQNRQETPKLTSQAIQELSQLARSYGIAVASHDDDTPEKVAMMQDFGATISEFPITLETARYAAKRGLFTIAGAPNVLLGGSHSGNLCATEAIVDGCVNILCSDYYPAAVLHAVFKLHKEKGLPLHHLINLVSYYPAQAVEMDDEIGSIEEGKKADVLIIKELESDFPALTHVFVDGQLISQTHYRD